MAKSTPVFRPKRHKKPYPYGLYNGVTRPLPGGGGGGGMKCYTGVLKILKYHRLSIEQKSVREELKVEDQCNSYRSS